jgi:hypothetical protein
MHRLAARRCMLLVAVLVVAVAGFCVSRLHGIFGSNHNTATPERLFGPPGTVATVNYHR